jgi:hypothetical protein
VLTLQAVLVLATGSVLLFLLQFPMANLALCILFARTAPTGRPLVAQLAAEVVALRQPSAAPPGLHSFFRKVPDTDRPPAQASLCAPVKMRRR